MATLDKAGIVASLRSQLGCTQQEARATFETIFERIASALEQGESVQLSGFGKFVVRSKRARVGRNPKTGETMEVTARRVVTFRPSSIQKERVKEGTEDE